MHQATFSWPFFQDSHRALAAEMRDWALANVADIHGDHDVNADATRLVRLLGDAGWLSLSVPKPYGGRHERLDVRSICIARESIARVNGLAEFAFAMQGLGAGPISLYGNEAQKQRWLPAVARGEAISAFAISELGAGSDVSAMRTTATREGSDWILNGEKAWISNAGIAHQYVVFARVAGEEKSFVALVVESGDAGFSVTGQVSTLAPHPLGHIRFDDCRLPADRVIGTVGKGLRVALGTLDVFRTTVGAAALGFARRAFDEALARAKGREMFGRTLGDLQLTQVKLAEMATEIDASALMVYRAAWVRDTTAARVTREAAMAKMYATEAAQRVIDSAIQLLGAEGVVSGSPVERLYRDIRALRIYEGATEVQQLVIAGQLLKAGQ
ncbi:MAG: acyl-CoA dehydrogenase protein [Gemmatimonadetes bacterium]|nr:acyl-CoA dehydrogenase protein [Gemmatimonadota bacterium]